jgi:hypothetical protein
MRVYMDWEFLDHRHLQDVPPISVGLYSDLGDCYYAAFRGMPLSSISGIDWLHDNVAPHLPIKPFKDGGPWDTDHPEYRAVKAIPTIRDEVSAFFRWVAMAEEKIELWGYYPSYDFFMLCKLYGRMMDLPGDIPRYIHDLRCEMDRLGVKHSELPAHTGREHHALDDAIHEKAVGDFLINLEYERGR